MTTLPRSCRERLQPQDYEFLVQALTGGSDGSESRSLFSLLMDPKTLDDCLDHASVLKQVLTQGRPLPTSPELYFYVLVRHGLKEAGIDDREVADYVAASLADYAHGDPLAELRQSSHDFDYQIDFLNAVEQATPYERFFLNVRCGNQFLLLSGLFPKFLRRRRDRQGAPGVRYYEQVARGAFQTAGGHPLADEFHLREVYETLADHMPETRRALNHLASEYLNLDATT